MRGSISRLRECPEIFIATGKGSRHFSHGFEVRFEPKMILYNLFPLLAGSFPGWNEHLTRAARMGFDWVYVNPIQQLGASRSLYSISDYFRLNPAFLNASSPAPPEQQCREALDACREHGLKFMVDLVINHC